MSKGEETFITIILGILIYSFMFYIVSEITWNLLIIIQPLN